MSILMDTTELRELEVNLGKVAGNAVKPLDAVVKRGAQNIKNHMNADLAASTHFRGASGSVTYDSEYGIGSIAYVIGPDKGRRGGGLGNIAYFGTSRGGGTVDVNGPLAEEEPRFVSELSKAAAAMVKL